MTLEQLLAFRPHQIVLENVPMDQLLTDALYYPDCRMDGEIIRSCNMHFNEIGICSFVLADTNVTEREFIDGQDGFRPYKILATRWFDKTEFGLDEPVIYSPRFAPYARWSVYQRLDGFDDIFGPERFSLLYFGGAGVTAEDIYRELFISRRITPKAVVGNSRLNDENDSFTNMLYKGQLPELIYYVGMDEDDLLDNDLYDYAFEADVHPGPGGRGSVTVWRVAINLR